MLSETDCTPAVVTPLMFHLHFPAAGQSPQSASPILQLGLVFCFCTPAVRLAG